VPASLVTFVAAVVLGAVALVVHVAVWLAVMRAPELSRAWRLGALLPPITPIAAWRAGKRKAAVAWCVLVAAYVVVRVIGGALG
jgi:hypothetical protein